MKIESGTIARTIVLFVALLNSVLTMCGANPLEISDDTIYSIVSAVFMIGSAVWSWWKNNSFTAAAKEADEYMKRIREAE